MAANTSLVRISQPVSKYRRWTGSGVAVWWLGQAGFLVRSGDTTIVIDAYLSDALALKYKEAEFAHVRMMAPPIAPENLTEIDFFISSHSHSDHMDPGLMPIARDKNPGCRFIMPDAVRNVGIERGAPADLIIGLDTGMELDLAGGISLFAIPSAHESLETDSAGRHKYLGFIIRFGNLSILHPGDCLPFPGYDDQLEPHKVDLALMPVNGRSDDLARRGIAGNFDFAQSLDIVKRHRMRYMIPHHYGMFDFNTVDRSELDEKIANSGSAERIFPAETGIMYHLTEG